MGLITQEVEVRLHGNNIKYFENKGYLIPRRIDNKGRFNVPKSSTILVKIEDLPVFSIIKIKVHCDNCCDKLENVSWKSYIECLQKHNKYLCSKCIISLFQIEKLKITRLKNGKSFGDWCIENNRQVVLDRWDYELNNCNPSEICYGSHDKYYFKCPRGIHKSELKLINSFTNGQEGSVNCIACNSFAQWGVDNIGKDFLEKYWDFDKNVNINPWIISYGYKKHKVWIKCQEKDYHESYDVSCNNFCASNSRCPYCRGLKVHKLDSIGYILKSKGLLNLWSNKNKKSSYEYSPFSQKEVLWKCENNMHKDYLRNIDGSNICNFRCPECVRERDESFLQEKVRLYLNELNYYVLHEHKCNIIAQNPKHKGSRGQMPYDNEVVELKLIIEVNGMQHYEVSEFHKHRAKKKNTTPEYELNMQKVRDRYKRIFAYKQKYEYLVIPCWTDDDEETWKKLINEKINNIMNKN